MLPSSSEIRETALAVQPQENLTPDTESRQDLAVAAIFLIRKAILSLFITYHRSSSRTTEHMYDRGVGSNWTGHTCSNNHGTAGGTATSSPLHSRTVCLSRFGHTACDKAVITFSVC